MLPLFGWQGRLHNDDINANVSEVLKNVKFYLRLKLKLRNTATDFFDWS